MIVRDGLPVAEAMRKAGYAASYADNGISAIRQSPGLTLAVLDEFQALKRSGLPDAEARGAFIRWRLLGNVLAGQDRAVQSLKLLGQDRDVSMFVPESQVGVVIVQAPAESVAMLDALGNSAKGSRADSAPSGAILAADSGNVQVPDDSQPK